MTQIVRHSLGTVRIEDRPADRRFIEVTPHSAQEHVPHRSWETRYPLSLIEHVVEVKGPAYLCEEIMRDESPHLVENPLKTVLFAHYAPERFATARILDFGCGSGASTLILARLFPQAEIVGVDISSRLLDLARHRAQTFGHRNIRYMQSVGGSELPSELGTFDVVLLNGVYEHFLPAERPVLLPLLFDLLETNGVLFVLDTPNRLWPIESHTSGLPLINYLPDGAAHWLTNRLSSRYSLKQSWEAYLRDGIRGAMVSEIETYLSNNSSMQPRLVLPTRDGCRDHADLWYRLSSQTRLPTLKQAIREGLKGSRRLTGIDFTPILNLAFEKRSSTFSPS